MVRIFTHAAHAELYVCPELWDGGLLCSVKRKFSFMKAGARGEACCALTFLISGRLYHCIQEVISPLEHQASSVDFICQCKENCRLAPKQAQKNIANIFVPVHDAKLGWIICRRSVGKTIPLQGTVRDRYRLTTL